MRIGLEQGAAPGAALAVGRYGRLVYLKGYGTIDYASGAPAVDASTMYDLASLTKVVATTTAAMILEEEGKLDISRTVQSYLPEFNAPDKAAITVRMLLTHRGGLEAFAPLWKDTRGRADYLNADQRASADVPAGHEDGLQRLGLHPDAGRHRAHHRHHARRVRRRRASSVRSA